MKSSLPFQNGRGEISQGIFQLVLALTRIRVHVCILNGEIFLQMTQVMQITSQTALDEDKDGKIEQLEQYTLPVQLHSFLQRNSQIKLVNITDHQR